MYRTLLDNLFKGISGVTFNVRYWDGTEAAYGEGRAAFRMAFSREPPLSGATGDPALFLGEAYMRGDLDLEGDFDAMIRALDAMAAPAGRKPRLPVIFSSCLALAASVRALTQEKKNIQAHYDLGNAFFRLWLDPGMNYSCAYFKTPGDSLALAQRQKIDLVLRKLRLRPGMRLLDIGCGWGELVVTAAVKYGVTATGITLSEEQHQAATRRVHDAGLEKRVEIRLENYQDLVVTRPFDRIVSVGMFEHVGQNNLSRYWARVCELLADGGLTLLHTITQAREVPANAWTAKYIFPGGYIPSLREILYIAPEYDFRILHVESMRQHYAKTLECWHADFSRPEVQDQTRGMFDEEFIRMWGLYLLTAAASFRTGSLDLHQIVCSKGIAPDLPLTLNDIYLDGPL